MKVLLIDDSESITKMISKFLHAQQETYEVDVANNGAIGLDRYTKFKPDVVVLDLTMPVMDGVETLTRILKTDKDANVIIASAADDKNRIETCLKKGAMGYIAKPYSPKELLNIIKNAIKGGAYKRDLITLFSGAGSKIQDSIRKIVGNNDLSIIFKDVDIIPHYSKTFTQSLDVYNIDVPTESFGFTTEIEGQLDGIIVSVINKKDLTIIFGKNNVEDIEIQNNETKEFFNIINSKLLSKIADFTQRNINATQISSFDKEKDGIIENKDLTRIWFDISWGQKTIPLDTYLWIDIGDLFEKKI